MAPRIDASLQDAASPIFRALMLAVPLCMAFWISLAAIVDMFR